MPETDTIRIVTQKKSALREIGFDKTTLKQSGFLFSPFEENKRFRKVLISPYIFCNENDLPKLNFSSNLKWIRKKETLKLKSTNKTEFENLVRKVKKEIAGRQSKKIVVAGILKKDKPENFNPVTFFKSLCNSYPHAFISLVFTPKYGLWVGATPEILLSVNKKNFKTYSLAGTKPNSKENSKTSWGKKEMEEQKIVSDYITKALSGITGVKPKLKGPETVVAGNLLHLRTTFSAKPVSNNLWQAVVKELHPTPAVAGLPKQKAMHFIAKHEKSPRGFYSGYLGPVNLDKQINLYVNIRCMQILKNKLAVYVGCGVTSGSNPLGEWKEAKNKAQTLLQVLRKVS